MLCKESFGKIGWDWGTNQPQFAPAGMLLNSSDIQGALREITVAAAGGGPEGAMAGEAVPAGEKPAEEEEEWAVPKVWQCLQTLDPLGATDATAGGRCPLPQWRASLPTPDIAVAMHPQVISFRRSSSMQAAISWHAPTGWGEYLCGGKTRTTPPEPNPSWPTAIFRVTPPNLTT